MVDMLGCISAIAAITSYCRAANLFDARLTDARPGAARSTSCPMTLSR